MAPRITPSKGGKPDKLMRDALMLALHREAEDANGHPTKKLNLLADKLIDKALTGDVPAIKEVIDRVDGKAPQSVTLDGELDVTETLITDRDRAKAMAALLVKARKQG